MAIRRSRPITRESILAGRRRTYENKPIPGAPARVRPRISQISTSAKAGRLRDFRGRFVKGGYGFSFVQIEACGESIQLYGARVGELARKQAMETLASAALQKMQTEAPWNDRTGDARAKLISMAIHNDKTSTSVLVLGHGVYYGYYLEFGLGGYYKIIEPTLYWAASRIPDAVVQAAPSSGSKL